MSWRVGTAAGAGWTTGRFRDGAKIKISPDLGGSVNQGGNSGRDLGCFFEADFEPLFALFN